MCTVLNMGPERAGTAGTTQHSNPECHLRWGLTIEVGCVMEKVYIILWECGVGLPQEAQNLRRQVCVSGVLL